MIRIEAVWLAVQPLVMRAGTEAALARVANVFGQAHPHHAYLTRCAVAIEWRSLRERADSYSMSNILDSSSL